MVIRRFEGREIPNLLRPSGWIGIAGVRWCKPVDVAGEGIRRRVGGPEDGGEGDEDLFEVGERDVVDGRGETTRQWG